MRFLKAIITILVVITSKAICFAQSEATVVYIEQYRRIAVQEMKRTGIPASITLAQGILESNSGESPLAKKFNNHFGIKCKNDWKGETTFQDDDAKCECFRVYPTAAASYVDHSNFLKNRPNYANLFLLDPLDDSAWAIGLKKSGYATATDYAKKLLKVIDDYELSQYNFPELEEEDEVAPSKAESIKEKTNNTIVATQPKKIDTATSITINKSIDTVATTIKDTVVKQSIAIDTTSIHLNNIKGIDQSQTTAFKSETTGPKVNSLPIDKQEPVTIVKEVKAKDSVTTQKPIIIPKGVFKINSTSVIWAMAGSSYLAIANQYHIPLFKLFEYNDIPEADLIEKDQLVFLEAKKKNGAKSLHTVKEGETLYTISQSEAVQYELLKSYNPSIGEKPLKEGTIVFLFKQKEEVPQKIETTKPITNPKRTLFNKLLKNN
jgi:LysM repeat protein